MVGRRYNAQSILCQYNTSQSTTQSHMSQYHLQAPTPPMHTNSALNSLRALPWYALPPLRAAGSQSPKITGALIGIRSNVWLSNVGRHLNWGSAGSGGRSCHGRCRNAKVKVWWRGSGRVESGQAFLATLVPLLLLLLSQLRKGA